MQSHRPRFQLAAPALIILLASTLALGGCAGALIGGVAVGASVSHDRRDTRTVFEDHQIEGDILLALRRAKVINRRTNISVTSYNGVVLLTGQVDDARTRDQAGEIANNTNNRVRRVVNEIVEAEPAPFTVRSNDAYLTAKAKTSLAGIRDLKGFDASRVKVVVAKRTLFLMGLLSRAEAEAATERVRRLRGVEKVVKVFEYTD